jgi:hypothetical protein
MWDKWINPKRNRQRKSLAVSLIKYACDARSKIFQSAPG